MERSALPVVALLLGLVASGASCRSAPRVPDPLHERISDVTVIDEQLHEAARELEALRREPRFALDTARRELAYPSLLTRYVDPSTLQPLKPDLESEYLDFAEKTTFATSPIAYDRALLARVRAVAALPSVESLTTGRNRILPFLTRMALLRDEELTPYRMLDGEVGPAPPRSYLRRVGLALLARRSMRGVVERMIRESPDDEEVALGLLQYLREDARTAGDGGCGDSLSYALEAHAEKEVPRRLAAPLVGRPARLSFEIALGLLRCLTDGRPTDGIRTLARGIIDARGRTPLTSTLPGAPEDLLAAARATAWSADHYPAVDGEAVLRAPRRTPLDPWAELWRDPTTVSDAIAARLAASSTQLFFHRDELLGNHARCAFAEGWLGWADQRTRPLFDVAAEPLFVTGALVANNSEARCLVRVLTHAEGLPPAWRAELVRRVLGAALAPFRWRGDALAWERGEGRWATDIEDEALAAVEDHPAWVSEDAELARQLLRGSGGILERSDAMFASSSHEGSAWTTHRPARPSEARALDALLRLPDDAPPLRAERRASMVEWIREIHRALAVKDPHAIGLYDRALSHLVAERLFLLAAHAPRYGLIEETREVLGLAAAPGWPPAPPPGRNAAAHVALAAAVASAELEDGAAPREERR